MTETGKQLMAALNRLMTGHLPDIANEPYEKANELDTLLSHIFRLVEELDGDYTALRTAVLGEHDKRKSDEFMGIQTFHYYSNSRLITGMRDEVARERYGEIE